MATPPETPPPQEPDPELTAQLSGIILKDVAVTDIPEKPALSLRWRFSSTDPSQALPDAPVEMSLNVYLSDQPTPIAQSSTKVSLKATSSSVVLPKGLRCGVHYAIELQLGGVLSNRLPLVVAEPDVSTRLAAIHEFESRFPVITPNGEWRESLPIPSDASLVHTRLVDDRETVVYQKSQKPDNSAGQSGWIIFDQNLKTDIKQSSQTFIRYYCFEWNSGLLSSWQKTGTLNFTLPETLNTIWPIDDTTVFLPQAAFFWQTIGTQTEGQLHFSLIRPDSPNYREADDAVRMCEAGQSPGLLLAVIPGLKSGDSFWWQVRVQPGRDRSIISSPWRKIVFQPGFDDFVTVLGKGDAADFNMGSENGQPDQQPVRRIHIDSGFAFSKTVLSNSQCALVFNSMLQAGEAIMTNGQIRSKDGQIMLLGLKELDYGRQFGLEEKPAGRISVLPGRENHPVIGISWYGASFACAWLNRVSGYSAATGYRLPTEAEWEYAASLGGQAPSSWGMPPRAGTANYLRSGDAFEDPLAPYTRKGGPTVPVSQYVASRLIDFRVFRQSRPGFDQRFTAETAGMDLLGNVWEWCSDWYLYTGYDPRELRNPRGPLELSNDYEKKLELIGQSPSRVVRGGAWNSSPSELTPQNRGKFSPGLTSFSIGFRIARTIP